MSVVKFIELSYRLEKYISDRGITGRLPGLYKLSRELGVNHVTLFKAMHYLAEQGKLEIVPCRGTYVVNPNREKRNYRAVGVVGYYYSADEAAVLFNALNRQFSLNGYRVLHIASSPQLLAEKPELFLHFPVDGFIFVGSSFSSEIAEVLKSSGIPAICTVNENFSEFNQVGMDHVEAYSRAIRMLKESGCRRIAYAGWHRNKDFQNYIDSIRNVFEEELGGDFDPGLFVVGDSEMYWEKYGEDYHNVFSKAIFSKWSSNPPDAIISYEQVCCRMKEYFPHAVTVSFSSLKPVLGVDWYFCEDYESVISLAVKRLLEIFAGDKSVTVQIVKFVYRTQNVYLYNNGGQK